MALRGPVLCRDGVPNTLFIDFRFRSIDDNETTASNRKNVTNHPTLSLSATARRRSASKANHIKEGKPRFRG